VPLASALVAHRDRYFDLLNSYRDGDVRPLIASFSTAARVAAPETRETAARLSTFPEQWRDSLGTVRRNSAAAKLLELLPGQPILSAGQRCAALDAPVSSLYTAIDRLASAGVLRPLVARKRDQVWGAALVLDELDDLGVRIATAVR
jgi:hypothetical protein